MFYPKGGKYILTEWNRDDEKLMLVVKKGSLDGVQQLLIDPSRRRADPVKLDPVRGTTALHVAASKGLVSVVDLFMRLPIDVDVRDIHGRTPLHCAVRNAHHDVTKRMLQHGANVNIIDQDHWSALHHACFSGHLGCIQLLLSADSLLFLKDKGRSPLLLAAWKGQASICRLLLENGASVNETDKDQRTALMLASEKGQCAVCDYLISKGADISLTDSYGHDAIWFSRKYDKLEVTKLLEQAQALRQQNGSHHILTTAQIESNNHVHQSQQLAKPVKPRRRSRSRSTSRESNLPDATTSDTVVIRQPPGRQRENNVENNVATNSGNWLLNQKQVGNSLDQGTDTLNKDSTSDNNRPEKPKRLSLSVHQSDSDSQWSNELDSYSRNTSRYNDGDQATSEVGKEFVEVTEERDVIYRNGTKPVKPKRTVPPRSNVVNLNPTSKMSVEEVDDESSNSYGQQGIPDIRIGSLISEQLQKNTFFGNGDENNSEDVENAISCATSDVAPNNTYQFEDNSLHGVLSYDNDSLGICSQATVPDISESSGVRVHKTHEDEDKSLINGSHVVVPDCGESLTIRLHTTAENDEDKSAESNSYETFSKSSRKDRRHTFSDDFEFVESMEPLAPSPQVRKLKIIERTKRSEFDDTEIVASPEIEQRMLAVPSRHSVGYEAIKYDVVASMDGESASETARLRPDSMCDVVIDTETIGGIEGHSLRRTSSDESAMHTTLRNNSSQQTTPDESVVSVHETPEPERNSLYEEPTVDHERPNIQTTLVELNRSLRFQLAKLDTPEVDSTENDTYLEPENRTSSRNSDSEEYNHGVSMSEDEDYRDDNGSVFEDSDARDTSPNCQTSARDSASSSSQISKHYLSVTLKDDVRSSNGTPADFSELPNGKSLYEAPADGNESPSFNTRRKLFVDDDISQITKNKLKNFEEENNDNPNREDKLQERIYNLENQQAESHEELDELLENALSPVEGTHEIFRTTSSRSPGELSGHEDFINHFDRIHHQLHAFNTDLLTAYTHRRDDLLNTVEPLCKHLAKLANIDCVLVKHELDHRPDDAVSIGVQVSTQSKEDFIRLENKQLRSRIEQIKKEVCIDLGYVDRLVEAAKKLKDENEAWLTDYDLFKQRRAKSKCLGQLEKINRTELNTSSSNVLKLTLDKKTTENRKCGYLDYNGIIDEEEELYPSSDDDKSDLSKRTGSAMLGLRESHERRMRNEVDNNRSNEEIHVTDHCKSLPPAADLALNASETGKQNGCREFFEDLSNKVAAMQSCLDKNSAFLKEFDHVVEENANITAIGVKTSKQQTNQKPTKVDPMTMKFEKFEQRLISEIEEFSASLKRMVCEPSNEMDQDGSESECESSSAAWSIGSDSTITHVTSDVDSDSDKYSDKISERNASPLGNITIDSLPAFDHRLLVRPFCTRDTQNTRPKKTTKTPAQSKRNLLNTSMDVDVFFDETSEPIFLPGLKITEALNYEEDDITVLRRFVDDLVEEIKALKKTVLEQGRYLENADGGGISVPMKHCSALEMAGSMSVVDFDKRTLDDWLKKDVVFNASPLRKNGSDPGRVECRMTTSFFEDSTMNNGIETVSVTNQKLPLDESTGNRISDLLPATCAIKPTPWNSTPDDFVREAATWNANAVGSAESKTTRESTSENDVGSARSAALDAFFQRAVGKFKLSNIERSRLIRAWSSEGDIYPVRRASLEYEEMPWTGSQTAAVLDDQPILEYEEMPRRGSQTAAVLDAQPSLEYEEMTWRGSQTAAILDAQPIHEYEEMTRSGSQTAIVLDAQPILEYEDMTRKGSQTAAILDAQQPAAIPRLKLYDTDVTSNDQLSSEEFSPSDGEWQEDRFRAEAELVRKYNVLVGHLRKTCSLANSWQSGSPDDLEDCLSVDELLVLVDSYEQIVSEKNSLEDENRALIMELNRLMARQMRTRQFRGSSEDNVGELSAITEETWKEEIAELQYELDAMENEVDETSSALVESRHSEARLTQLVDKLQKQLSDLQQTAVISGHSTSHTADETEDDDDDLISKDQHQDLELLKSLNSSFKGRSRNCNMRFEDNPIVNSISQSGETKESFDSTDCTCGRVNFSDKTTKSIKRKSHSDDNVDLAAFCLHEKMAQQIVELTAELSKKEAELFEHRHNCRRLEDNCQADKETVFRFPSGNYTENGINEDKASLADEHSGRYGKLLEKIVFLQIINNRLLDERARLVLNLTTEMKNNGESSPYVNMEADHISQYVNSEAAKIESRAVELKDLYVKDKSKTSASGSSLKSVFPKTGVFEAGASSERVLPFVDASKPSTSLKNGVKSEGDESSYNNRNGLVSQMQSHNVRLGHFIRLLEQHFTEVAAARTANKQEPLMTQQTRFDGPYPLRSEHKQVRLDADAKEKLLNDAELRHSDV